MSFRLELVVARHREDLRWLRRVPSAFRVTVYDKGDGRHGTVLPNEGREAHTYLHHIVTRYDSLAPVTVFVQGKPFDHVPDLHRRLKGLAAEPQGGGPFLWMGFLIDADDRTGSLLFRAWSKNPEGHPLPMEAFFDALWPGESCPERFVFYPGAHFAVTADQVRTRPESFYRRALGLSRALPEAAHCFERCWDRVFGVDGIPPAHRGAALPVFFKPIRRLIGPAGMG